jgi:hypothetical protein
MSSARLYDLHPQLAHQKNNLSMNSSHSIWNRDSQKKLL